MTVLRVTLEVHKSRLYHSLLFALCAYNGTSCLWSAISFVVLYLMELMAEVTSKNVHLLLLNVSKFTAIKPHLTWSQAING